MFSTAIFSLACTRESINGSYTIDASIPSMTKTTIGAKTSDGYNIYWQTGDVINANGQTSYGLEQGNTTRATFRFASPLSEPCNCIYPAYVLSDGNKVNILSEQSYRDGSFDPAVAVLLSSGNKKQSLEFHHAMSYFKIIPDSQSGDLWTKSATVVSMGEEMLSGHFSTNFATLTTIPGESSSMASVICDSPVPNRKSLIVAIPAGYYSKGLMLIIRESDGTNKMTSYSQGPVTAAAGCIYNCEIKYSRDILPDNLYLLGGALKNGGWTTPAIISNKGNGIYESDGIEFEFNEKDKDNPEGFKIFETNPTVTGIWAPQYGMAYDSGANHIIALKGSDVYQVYPGKLGFASGTYKIKVDLVSMTISLTSVSPGPTPPSPTEPTTLVDQKATAQTRALFAHLKSYWSSGKTLFGAQIPTLFGIDNWQYWGARNNVNTDKSDTKCLAGSHPAVCGWELAWIEKGSERDVDGNYFSAVRNHIQAAYRRGAVNTISWHCCNPATDGNYNDSSAQDVINRILPGGDLHSKFCGWMDKAAEFLASLTDDNGNPIPIIFRPWHEHTDRGRGSGFWWSVGNNSNDSYKKLWQMTFEYMTTTKGLHNLIWAYSPDLHHLCWDDEGYNKYVYTWAWPGDGYVDILGLDAYHTGSSNFDSKASVVADYAISLAVEKGKIFAVTETGLLNNDWDNYWWTGRLYAKLIAGKKVAYALVWRNDYPDYYFNAFRGCCSANDFLDFVGKDDVLLENELDDLYK